MAESKHILKNCLYFAANSLARVMTKMAEEEFRITGLSPSHAFVLMMILEYPGIGPKELSKHLEVTPSTITRFLDQLQIKGLIERQTEGKTAAIYPTKKGEQLKQTIKDAWKTMYDRYNEKIGKKFGENLTGEMNKALNLINS